ncbi:hypothetical protein SAOUHSC_02473 [Staphylococcus aureus subsp. aureus NCTC 8325]|uniref:Uncharacterized protein n=1 Tax=Staphylococcus aureus (strain NCTC 8325 / PS 47) TaxID=93061 RepID=Q2FW44_STAA8|nr:hypothetical protein [Staphylococcus aureus]YP_500941.1 hypothetical protein SAOUHSC_02473 [Staphylococcus aureus subsp. aureus NCTC 8325]ABD31493.1 hypothetical protein SAOUHSC_02473 [Staphylococcus aureus subsp. aureus NCTC 8325]
MELESLRELASEATKEDKYQVYDVILAGVK